MIEGYIMSGDVVIDRILYAGRDLTGALAQSRYWVCCCLPRVDPQGEGPCGLIAVLLKGLI
jgi:hypothetical protein